MKHIELIAGENLPENCALEPGMLLTLEPGVLQEVIPEPDIRLLITKFKG